MLTFTSFKAAKDIGQGGYSGFFFAGRTDFIEKLGRVASWLGAILNLSPLVWGITTISVDACVWCGGEHWSPLTLHIIFDESWNMFSNGWRIIDC